MAVEPSDFSKFEIFQPAMTSDHLLFFYSTIAQRDKMKLKVILVNVLLHDYKFKHRPWGLIWAQ